MTLDMIDTMDALLARYVAGTLPEPSRILVSAHLKLKGQNRPFVRNLEALAGIDLEAVAPEPLSKRDERLAAIFASTASGGGDIRMPEETGSIFPRELQDFVGYRAEDVPWRTKLPGLKEYEMGVVDGCEVSLFWIKPGRAVPSHTHEGTELFLVLDGAFNDAMGHYGRGDISVADESVDHRPVAENDRPCIGLSVTDAPLRLTGSFGQRIGDLFGS